MNTQLDESLKHGSLSKLITGIEQSHHVFTRAELNRITDIFDEIKQKDLPLVTKIKHYFMELQEDLLPHLMKEEYILFPFIRELENDPEHLPTSCFGSVSNPIRMMQVEHGNVMSLLGKLRELTAHYTPAPDSNAHTVELFMALSRLDEDLVQHIQWEDDVLFPRTLQLESERSAQN